MLSADNGLGSSRGAPPGEAEEDESIAASRAEAECALLERAAHYALMMNADLQVCSASGSVSTARARGFRWCLFVLCDLAARLVFEWCLCARKSRRALRVSRSHFSRDLRFDSRVGFWLSVAWSSFSPLRSVNLLCAFANFAL